MTKPIDLRADLAKIVHEIIVRYLPAGVSVRVFGSRANWTAKSHSDLDLALKGSEKLPSSLIDELAEAFSESDLPIRVDVVDWHAVPPKLQAVIRRDGAPFTIQLGEIATLLSGGTPSKSNEAFWGGEIPWLTPKDMSQWDGTTQAHVTAASVGRGTRLAPPNAVFVAVRGMSLHNEIRVIRSEKPITFNQDIKAIVAGPLIDPHFLFYAITAAKGELLGLVSAAGHGTGVLDTDRLRSLELRSLPLVEQRSIARAIGALDDKIELNRRMNETLEAMARAIFRDWFVDFGPTRAKMEGRAPYLAPDIWSLFPDRLDDEGKPEGWELRPVRDVAELRGGKQLEKERITSAGTIPVFGGAGIMGFTDEHNTEGFVISVGRVGAYCGQFFSHRGKAWINNNASLIQQFEWVSGEWLFQSLKHADIEVIKKGAAQPFVSNTDVSNMPIIWPGEHVVARFADIAGPLMLRIEHNEAEASSLATTRDFLLPKLMSGEVRVTAAEDLIGEAAWP